jgi:Uma2 family endonuclease
MSAHPDPPLPPQVLLTAEEFLTLPEPAAGKLELHDGRVVEVAPASPRHSGLQTLIAAELLLWCRRHGAGYPVVELTC